MKSIALDIGNSAVKAAAFENGLMLEPIRSAVGSVDDASTLLRRLGADSADVPIAMCSVVPSVAQLFEQAAHRASLYPPKKVEYRESVGFAMAYETPATLGSDRLAAAAGGWTEFGKRNAAVLVIDAGTATTIEVVDRTGRYLGGPILASPGLVAFGLSRGTAQLPDVELVVPDSAIGSSTASALQSGIMFGFVDGVRGLLRRILDQVGRDATVVVTGGWSTLLASHISEVTHHRPHIVLEGVAALT